MKIETCKKCQHYQRRVWSASYKPNNYHLIGVSHAYGFCLKNQCRCLNIKKCPGVNK